MSRKFWQLDSCLLNESRLQLIVSELISYPNEFDGGYIGNPLKVREESVIPPKRAASKSRINTSPAFSAGRVSLLKPSYAFALE